jgi:HlyD family secretion protein
MDIMKRTIIIAVSLAAILGGGFLIARKSHKLKDVAYETVAVTKGSVARTISSTGTLNPVSTIEIGTQVSGKIIKVNVDYNSIVKKNQIIAEIDKEPLQNRLTQVQAAYSKAQAMYEQAQSVYERNKPLHEKSLISDDEFVNYKTSYLAQKATLDGAKADVENAITNLKYAIVKSPVDGIVIKRSVDVGQTVAASLSAPTLFIVAEDLHKMQILADVDESDIGKIQTGQAVTFTVPAFPDKAYNGTVDQVRLQPQTVQNVVTYSVVIKADNGDGLLLPGMTANVEFIAEKEDDAFLVPSTALRFKPTDDLLQKIQSEMTKEHAQKTDGPDGLNHKNGWGGDHKNSDKMPMEKPGVANRATLWILTDTKVVRPLFVHLGISDGQLTSVKGRNIEEGIRVITGVADKKSSKKQSKSKSLFATQGGPPGGGGGGGPGGPGGP